MLELGPASTHEMVLCFLRAEIDSPKWGPRYSSRLAALRLDRFLLIDNADLNDGNANCERAALLGAVRGYGSNEYLFQGFPLDTAWRRVSIEPSEFHQLKYIGKDSDWQSRSGGTLSVQDGAQNYIDTKLPSSVGDALLKIQRGVSIPELILVEGAENRLIVLEGNTRATAFVVAGTNPISALVGRSPTMYQWVFI